MAEDKTLDIDALRAESPEIIEAIEKPLKREIASLTAERDALKEEKWQGEKKAYIHEFAGKFTSDPVKAEAILTEKCKDAKDITAVQAASAQILMEVMEIVKQEAPGETIAEQLRKLIPGVQAGGSSVQKTPAQIAAENSGKTGDEAKDKNVVPQEIVSGLDVVASW